MRLQLLLEIIQNNAKVIMVDYNLALMYNVMCAAHELKMGAKEVRIIVNLEF